MASVPVTPTGYYDESVLLVFTYTLGPNQPAYDLSLSIDKDSDFLWERLHGASTGSYDLNIRYQNGASWANTAVDAGLLVGTTSAPTFIYPTTYNAGSRVSIDLKDTSGATNKVTLLFGGMRRFRT